LFRQTFGARDRRTLLALSDLALTRTRLDHRAEALRLGEEALTNAVAAFGDRLLPGNELAPDAGVLIPVHEVGFLIADKQDGPFRLEISSIKAAPATL